MADYGIVTLPLIPMRKSASHRAEMISQLIFGECFTILEAQDGWIYIENNADDYLGWIERKQIILVPEATANAWINQPKRAVSSVFTTLACHSTESTLMIPAGALLPLEPNFTIERLSYSQHPLESKPTEVVGLAKQFLNAPYLWGGKSIMGLDCSGFSQTVFRIMGYNLPRDAWQQAEIGRDVEFLEEAVTGDLAYFHNDEGRITHVGILISPTQIIHCSGSVRIDTIDDHGIFNNETGGYTHQLRFIKRVIG